MKLKRTILPGDGRIDFAWILYIGTGKLGLSKNEVGRLTMKEFNQMLCAYRQSFTLELNMKNIGVGYNDITNEKQSETIVYF